MMNNSLRETTLAVGCDFCRFCSQDELYMQLKINRPLPSSPWWKCKIFMISLTFKKLIFKTGHSDSI